MNYSILHQVLPKMVYANLAPTFFIFLMVLLIGNVSALAGESERPNVLFLMADDHRADVMGVAGDSFAITPNLNRLAADGVRFTHFASQSPVCVPSRATIMTGMYDLTHNVQAFHQMNVNTTYLAEVFAGAGYTTGYAGKWHLNGTPLFSPREETYVPPEKRRGFQEWDGYDGSADHDNPVTFIETQDPPVMIEVEGYDWSPTYYTDVFLDFAERHASDDEPWMYFISYAMPHRPEEAPENFLSMFPPEDFDLFAMAPELQGNITAQEEQLFRNILQVYYAQVSFIDSEIGSVLDGLDEMGLSEDTLVIYFSDHGQLLGSHFFEVRDMGSALGGDDVFFRAKSLPYAAAFRAPMIMNWPGVIPTGIEVDALMSMVDLPTTVLDLADLAPPKNMQGRSMREWCIGGVGPNADGLYLTLSVTDELDWEAVWTGNYIFSSTDDYQILYDHVNDPQELVNLYEEPTYAAVREELQLLVDSLAAAATTIPESSSGGGSCLIANVAHGTPLVRELPALRSFRDDWLLNNAVGSTISNLYYQLSPHTVHWISARDDARSSARGILWLALALGRFWALIPVFVAVAIWFRMVRP
jgi:arylsulfatase A-like enzyme